jgi:hypothetical protein
MEGKINSVIELNELKNANTANTALQKQQNPKSTL